MYSTGESRHKNSPTRHTLAQVGSSQTYSRLDICFALVRTDNFHVCGGGGNIVQTSLGRYGGVLTETHDGFMGLVQ